MSYLRGPLTRVQIKQLMEGRQPASPASQPAAGTVAPAAAATPRQPPKSGASVHTRPVLPPEVPQLFVPPRAGGGELFYEPKVLAIGKIYYADAKAGIATEEQVALLADPAARVDWDAAEAAGFAEPPRAGPGEDDALFGLVPPEAANGRSYPAWRKAFTEWLYRTRRLELLKSPSTGMVSSPGESERDFRIRLQTAAHEKRDAVVQKVRQSYAPRIARLGGRIHAAARRPQFDRRRLGAFLGRGHHLGSGGRPQCAAPGAMKRPDSVAQPRTSGPRRSARRVAAGDGRQIARGRGRPATEPLERVELAPNKKDVAVSTVALAWVPRHKDT
jgi:hypothetical protein